MNSTSPCSASASCKASALLPLAVGPARQMPRGFKRLGRS